MKAESIKIADTILARGNRVLMVPVKNGERIFEIDQKEVQPGETQNEIQAPP